MLNSSRILVSQPTLMEFSMGNGMPERENSFLPFVPLTVKKSQMSEWLLMSSMTRL